MRSLFLAWQASDGSPSGRAWFPVGLLEAAPERSDYRFRYIRGAMQAQQEAGFEPLLAFPDFKRDYRSERLFPLFENRVLSPKRRDFGDYIEWLDLDRDRADPIAILSVSGGQRMTDNLEVFPKVSADAEGHFRVRFFLHGVRHLDEQAVNRAIDMQSGDPLRVMVELNNPATRLAVSLFTDDYRMIGWAPRYLIGDLIASLARNPEIEAKVARVNVDAPLNQRVLIEYNGRMPEGVEPMSGPDFKPLID